MARVSPKAGGGVCSLLLILLFAATVAGKTVASPNPRSVIQIFQNEQIRFTGSDPAESDGGEITVLDNGRIIQRSLNLPTHATPLRITAHLIVNPIPKDELSMHDGWDRAGSIRLVSEEGPDLELVKFITAYGGRTEWSVDVSHLAPLLRGPVTLAAFIDTWVNPAWRIDLSLEFTPDDTLPTYHWVSPVFSENSFDLETYGRTGALIPVNVQGDHQRVMLYYLVSGHCTDGRGADEFVKRDNVLLVDGRVVYRYRPWRDDCRRFREINPYTRRWSDGWWSSDYPRSGWCPGDIVTPLILDLTDHFTDGDHELGIRIEAIRPRDEGGNHGYWRVSAFLVGVTDSARQGE